MRECSVDGCHTRAKARGWCPTHYWQWRRTGHALPQKLSRAEVIRIRRMLGLPADGPTNQQHADWDQHESDHRSDQHKREE